MANTSILFVDLLGVQRMWAEGGAPAVKARIDEFNAFLLAQLEYLPGHLHKEGEYTAILAGDSASIMCQDFDQAIGIGCHLFTQAFYDTNKRKQLFWLRGAVARWHNQYLPINTQPIKAKGIQIGTQYVNEDDYLTVLALEKSGFRGMRLIVDKKCLPSGGLTYQRHWESCKKSIGYVVTLKECTYPHGSDYGDILWMTESESQYDNLKGIMAHRFKTCTQHELEFSQASWTRSVFDQADSIITGCK